MTLISTVTVGSGGASSIDFTSIPQTATDLYLLVSGRGTSSGYDNGYTLRLNGDNTSGNYAFLRLTGYGDNSNVSADGGNFYLGGAMGGTSTTANTFSSTATYIPNYTGSNSKSYSIDTTSENNGSTYNQQFQQIYAVRWTGTAAITSISLQTSTNFAQYSTASLYGILKGSGGATVS